MRRVLILLISFAIAITVAALVLFSTQSPHGDLLPYVALSPVSFPAHTQFIDLIEPSIFEPVCETPVVPLLTKAHFRCKGRSTNPPHLIYKENRLEAYIDDCNGCEAHSLPIRDGKEYIAPLLIELLNYLQTTFQRQLIITEGHSCPTHAQYLAPRSPSCTSKHQIGAAVSFYIPDTDPAEVLQAIERYYATLPRTKDRTPYTRFERYEKSTDVSTKPWMNKELFVKLYLPHEGRTIDTPEAQHYFELQVRHDYETNSPVQYSWDAAQCLWRY